MSEPNGKIKTAFKYIDEYDNITEVIREVDSDYLGMGEGDILCELFRDFMVACGFNYLSGKKIDFADE